MCPRIFDAQRWFLISYLALHIHGYTPRSLPSPTTRTASLHAAIETKTANVEDFLAVADLRLSVFAGGDRATAWEKITERRMKGAVCLVAHVTSNHSSPLLAGTLECSSHEFSCDKMWPELDDGARLYITEVAVAPRLRRRGVALALLRAAEGHAREGGVQALYLHVEANNAAALRLYRRAGFRALRETAETESFSRALGLCAHKKHTLMSKELFSEIQETAWCI